MRDNFFPFGQEASVGAKHLNEGVNFGFSGFTELDEVITLVGRKEIESMYYVELGIYAVNASDPLN